jgi:hypothetical protein
VTETLGHDGFGNVNKGTVAGAGMAARVTQTDWGTTNAMNVQSVT